MNSNDTVIVSALRTPFSPFGGVLKEMHSSDLGALVIREVLERVEVPGKIVDELYYGMCIQSEAALESNVNARQALLKAGMPEELISLTVDRACCSSLTCLQLGIRTIKAGDGEVILAVGAENMSNTPLVMNGHRWGTGLRMPTFKDHLNPIYYSGHNPLAQDAGEVALEHGIDRQAQDEWALRSQHRYQEAFRQGKFADELVPVTIPRRKGEPIVFAADAFPKPDTSLEKLARLKTVYGSPTVTAGNAPGLDAGAAAILIMKRSRAEALGLEPQATIVTVQSVATKPRVMAEAPAYAINKALGKANLDLADIDLIEINEAFAAMPLVSTKILAGDDEQRWNELQKITNVNGGAIAIGHPVGASGARIIMTLMYELRRRGGGLGAASICGGLAQADAAIIRVEKS